MQQLDQAVEDLAGEQLTPTELQLLLESHNLSAPQGRVITTLQALHEYSGVPLSKLSRGLLRVRMLGLSNVPIENRGVGMAVVDEPKDFRPSPDVTAFTAILNLPSATVAPRSESPVAPVEASSSSPKWLVPVCATLLVVGAGSVLVRGIKSPELKPAPVATAPADIAKGPTPPPAAQEKPDPQPLKVVTPFRCPANFDPR